MVIVWHAKVIGRHTVVIGRHTLFIGWHALVIGWHVLVICHLRLLVAICVTMPLPLMLLVAISVIMPRGLFGLSVLGQMQVLGKLYKMENPTCKIPCAIWTFVFANLAPGPFSQSIVYG